LLRQLIERLCRKYWLGHLSTRSRCSNHRRSSNAGRDLTVRLLVSQRKRGRLSPVCAISRDTEARGAETIREASSVPEGNDASPLTLLVGAAETAGRTLPVVWEVSVCGFGIIGMSLLAVGVGVITGIGAGFLLK